MKEIIIYTIIFLLFPVVFWGEWPNVFSPYVQIYNHQTLNLRLILTLILPLLLSNPLFICDEFTV